MATHKRYYALFVVIESGDAAVDLCLIFTNGGFVSGLATRRCRLLKTERADPPLSVWSAAFPPAGPCHPNPCHNRGACEISESFRGDTFIGYICKCPPGFSGIHCQHSKSVSSPPVSRRCPMNSDRFEADCRLLWSCEQIQVVKCSPFAKCMTQRPYLKHSMKQTVTLMGKLVSRSWQGVICRPKFAFSKNGSLVSWRGEKKCWTRSLLWSKLLIKVRVRAPAFSFFSLLVR